MQELKRPAHVCITCWGLWNEAGQCGPTAGLRRPAPHPGPRCATHHREVKRARSTVAHNARVQKTYGIGPDGYARLMAAQEGRCWICRRGPGRRRRLAVDHDHVTGEVRGLLCVTCNRILGMHFDRAEVFKRMHEYLTNPPARAVLS